MIHVRIVIGNNMNICFLFSFNPLNAELNPIRHLLALAGVRHIVHVSRLRVKDNQPIIQYGLNVIFDSYLINQ